jgi:hypothetical protein
MSDIFQEPTEIEEKEIIKRAAETIYKYEMDLIAILILESLKPLVSVGGQLTRYMVAPFVPLVGKKSIPWLATFQRKENVEKLIRELEKIGRLEEEKNQRQKAKNKKTDKKNWRRYLPF